MANYFRKTIKLDEGCLYRREIFIDCKRYVDRDRRWRLGIIDPMATNHFSDFVPGTFVIGDRAEIKAKIAEILAD